MKIFLKNDITDFPPVRSKTGSRSNSIDLSLLTHHISGDYLILLGWPGLLKSGLVVTVVDKQGKVCIQHFFRYDLRGDEANQMEPERPPYTAHLHI